MSLEADFLARLQAVAPIAEIVGERISWFELPREGGFPAISLAKISPGRTWTHQGPQGLVSPNVQIDSWAEDPDVVDALRQAVQAEMERLDEVTIGGTTFVPPAFLEIDQPIADEIGGVNGQGGTKIYRWLQEFSFFAKPA